jgi:hypothetical protein
MISGDIYEQAVVKTFAGFPNIYSASPYRFLRCDYDGSDAAASYSTTAPSSSFAPKKNSSSFDGSNRDCELHRASGQFEDVGFENRKFVLDDIPEYFVFQNIVAVSQHVPQADDFVNITNFFSKIRMVASQPG